MTFETELYSWLSPSSLAVATPPTVGGPAPSTGEISFPRKDGKPILVAFLRHCGCPFAEKTFLILRHLAASQPEITSIAVSHSSQASTGSWLAALGGPGAVQVICNPSRSLYAGWGLGIAGFWHVLNPWSMWSVVKLAKDEGIKNRPTETGNRWQMSGVWAVDAAGVVKWGGVAAQASDVKDVGEGVRALEDGR